MAYVEHELSLLIRLDPERARRRVAAAIRARDGVALDVAADLGISQQTLARWIEALDLRELLRELRQGRGQARLRREGRAAVGGWGWAHGRTKPGRSKPAA